MGIPSRLGSHRIHLTRGKLSFGTTEADEAPLGLVRTNELTIGQLNRRRVGVNARKNTSISYIRMGDQRDWFSVGTNGSRRIVSISMHITALIILWGFSAAKRGRFERNTDPMKVCAIAGWSRGEGIGFSKVCGRFGGYWLCPPQTCLVRCRGFQTPIDSAIALRQEPPPASKWYYLGEHLCWSARPRWPMRSRLEGRNIPEIMAIEIDIRALMISSQIVEKGVKHFD